MICRYTRVGVVINYPAVINFDTSVIYIHRIVCTHNICACHFFLINLTVLSHLRYIHIAERLEMQCLSRANLLVYIFRHTFRIWNQTVLSAKIQDYEYSSLKLSV